eukprot:scaffold3250_cov222-Pinguiococcus_pyrenoidosus.AAC.3
MVDLDEKVVEVCKKELPEWGAGCTDDERLEVVCTGTNGSSSTSHCSSSLSVPCTPRKLKLSKHLAGRCRCVCVAEGARAGV